jgi:secreted PhoX family phosphatase
MPYLHLRRHGAHLITASAIVGAFALAACSNDDNKHPKAELSAASLSFPATLAGKTSAAQTLTLSNQGDGELTIAGITADDGFTQTNDCGTSLAALASCEISVAFAPTAAGAVTGKLSVAGNSEISASLSGTGLDTTAAFAPIDAAASDAAKRQIIASDYATIDGTTREIGYVTILRSGEQRGSSSELNVYGQIVDNARKPIHKADGSTTIADSNDFSSILKVGGKLYTVSQFESQPGAMYLTELSQDSETGKLSALGTTALDLSGINGIWNPCAGSVTPWNTHLSSEEYEPDARKGASSASSMAGFFGGGSVPGGDASKVNPYFWGYPVEVAISDAGTPAVSKHYSMGRFAHELSYVMPDKKSVYQTDDGTNVGFYRYVADTAGDLSKGTLYAMKWTQTSAAGASELGTADISWIELGHASDAEIKTLIDSGVAFADIFETASATAGACPADFVSVNANGVGQECLKLKAGQEKAAAFLESRRYAAYLGATTELRKEEGVSFDPKGMKLYVAYSEVNNGMEDNKKAGVANTGNDIGGPNHIKLMYNQCGAIYAYDVDASYTATKAAGILTGRMTTKRDPNKLNPTTIDAYAADSPFVNNSCDVNAIANPDNVSFMADQDTLLIGEDSGDEHQNDAVWAYNVKSKELTRIGSTPYGAETTSLYYYPDVNDFGYIMFVVQHPYGESDGDKVAAGSAERRSYLGYVGSLPAHK